MSNYIPRGQPGRPVAPSAHAARPKGYGGDPEPGYWMIRLVKNGPLVPACIRWVQTGAEPGEPENVMERSPFLAAFIDEKPVDIDRVWNWKGSGRAIAATEYSYRCADAAWAREHAPTEPAANPKKQIDFTEIDPIF